MSLRGHFSLPCRRFRTACQAALWLLLTAVAVSAEEPKHSNSVSIGPDPFLQVTNLLPAPSESRLASGAPGPTYWQQRVSYDIEATLDEDQKMIRGREKIRYENNSPHTLTYLWMQLDANQFSPNSDATLAKTWKPSEPITVQDYQTLLATTTFDGSMRVSGLKDSSGKALDHFVNKDLLRINLPKPLPPGGKIDFELTWEYRINNGKVLPARTGYEMLEDGNALFGIAQWYPRLCAYTDYGGWRVKQYLRSGEFTIEFGDFDVRLNVPADHVLIATGELVNPGDVLSSEEQERLKKADASKEPVFIVTREEADARRKNTSSPDLKTWHFKADNVRDFAFASSRAYVWDALGCPLGDKVVRCQSIYPREGMPLWDHYATHSVAQAVEVYSDFTGIPYPWPHATAALAPVAVGGMEYPMISFNSPAPEKDGSYSEKTKNALIGVIIHETGHNWFPMIINSDERHWMWLDEGLNRFVQGEAERRWTKRMVNDVGQPKQITDYLTADVHQPIMTQADNLLDVSKNAYWKTAVGLTMLRETILGRELFDTAFKEYCRRWQFKRAEPADLFRTLEDSAGMDLDWFWRGWFFSTAYCDMDLASVTKWSVHTGDPAQAAEHQKRLDEKAPTSLTLERDAEMARRVERHPGLLDFYDTYDQHAVTEKKQEEYKKFLERLTPEEKEALEHKRPLYELKIRNKGELPMPVTVQLEYDDGSKEVRRYPVEVWRHAERNLTLMVFTPKPLVAVTVDPYNETADPDLTNNRFPRKIEEIDVKLANPEKKIENPLHDSMQEKEKK